MEKAYHEIIIANLQIEINLLEARFKKLLKEKNSFDELKEIRVKLKTVREELDKILLDV